jgi:hypothetical protein
LIPKKDANKLPKYVMMGKTCALRLEISESGEKINFIFNIGGMLDTGE